MAEKRDMYQSERRPLLRTLLSMNAMFSRIYHRVDVLAPQRLPRKGPAILVSNHLSALDPMLIQAVCPRAIIWMMAKEYYEIPYLRPLFAAVEAIPVDRGKPESGATRSALRALAAGRVLGIFPEAKWETSRDLLPFQTGVALIALKTGAPVFPVYLDGTQRYTEMTASLLVAHQATLRFGNEVQLDRTTTGKAGMVEGTKRIEEAVKSLHPDRFLTRRRRK